VNWGAYSALFSLATFKFMFAAFPGPALDLSFIETFLCVFSGGTLSAAVFYFSSDFFMLRASQRRIEKMKKLGESGKPVKKFTFVNKFIVRCKNKFGIYVICFWAPFFMSVPLGSIVVAKFYGKLKMTYLYITLGMFINACITTFLAYVIF